MGMGILWDSHGNGNGDEIGNGNGKEWETTCMGMGMAIIPTGINSHRRIQCLAYVIQKLVKEKSSRIQLVCDLPRKSKIKTYNILNYYFSGFCTIKMHTCYC